MSKTPSRTPSRSRAAAPPAQRSAVPTTGRIAKGRAAIYDAASRHPLIPLVTDPAPSVTARQQRFLQVLARHLYRNDAIIRNVVNASGRLYVGDGPVPVSRFPELDDLWQATSRRFDNTGRRSFCGWLRQDVYRNYRIDGEVFVRRRDREDAPEAADLIVPVEWEAHTSEFCPLEYNQISFGLRYVCGIAHVRSKPVRYQMYAEHPGEGGAIPQLLDLDREEIYHVHDPLTGSPRGEVGLASALLRAIKANTLEDAELRRKQVATLMSIFIERPIDAGDDEGMIPSADDVNELIDSVSLSPGGVFQLPYGYKQTAFTPADEPANFEKALRWQYAAICASVGIPVYEVFGDDGVERWGRMMSQRVQSLAHLEHDMLEHQLLNRMRDDWIDSVQVAGLWTPPENLKPWELYECDWQWPPTPQARIDQELGAMSQAVKDGHLPHSHVGRTLWGLKPAVAARQSARDAARGAALGHVWAGQVWTAATPAAARIAAAVEAEEAEELDVAEASQMEDSVLDDDLV